MAMRYADEATVLAELSLNDENPDDATAITRVRSLELGLCETFDEKIGRSFGTAPVAETRTVAVGQAWGTPSFGGMPLADYSNTFRSPRLVLSTPLRTLVSIETGGSWDGTAWVDGETLATSAYLLTNKARDGYHGIDRLNGTWSGLVRITGIWGDQPTADVPVDVREAMHFIVTETYRQQQASPADELGPDNMVVRPRNPWRYEQVVQAINRHRIVQVLV
jgi:hypothetical protein